MNEDTIKGAAKEVGGAIKENVGAAVGNDRLEAEGAIDRFEGKTQKNVGKVEDAVEDQVDRS
jgi:uncharacterized protein YjbJ (UPF0337 family)